MAASLQENMRKEVNSKIDDAVCMNALEAKVAPIFEEMFQKRLDIKSIAGA